MTKSGVTGSENRTVETPPLHQWPVVETRQVRMLLLLVGCRQLHVAAAVFFFVEWGLLVCLFWPFSFVQMEINKFIY